MFRTLVAVCLLSVVISTPVFSLDRDKVEAIKSVLREVQITDQAGRVEIEEKSKKYLPNSKEMNALWVKQNAIDAENQRQIANILEQYGWPKKQDFGSIGPSQVVFLVVQHAPHDYQKRYVEMARQAAKAGDLLKSSLALLEDRLLVSEGKKQIYGSQVSVNQETGKMTFFPIENEANVDARRAEVGLQPLAEYAKHFDIEYVYKKD